MAHDPPAPPAVPHTHTEHCAVCGEARTVERSYTVNDRMLRMLIGSLARQRGLTVTRPTRKTSMTVYVAGPDAATLDAFDARLDELMAKLDAQLLAVTEAFLREHTGAAPPRPPPAR